MACSGCSLYVTQNRPGRNLSAKRRDLQSPTKSPLVVARSSSSCYRQSLISDPNRSSVGPFLIVRCYLSGGKSVGKLTIARTASLTYPARCTMGVAAGPPLSLLLPSAAGMLGHLDTNHHRGPVGPVGDRRFLPPLLHRSLSPCCRVLLPRLFLSCGTHDSLHHACQPYDRPAGLRRPPRPRSPASNSPSQEARSGWFSPPPLPRGVDRAHPEAPRWRQNSVPSPGGALHRDSNRGSLCWLPHPGSAG